MTIEIINNELGTFGKCILSKSAYSSEILTKVAYNFTDESYVFISEDNHNYLVNLTLINENTKKSVRELCGNFLNELVDQEMRQIVLNETGKIRETIISAAFSEAAKGLSPVISQPNVPKAKHSYVNDKMGILELKG